MDEQQLREVIYGGITGLMSNPKYFHRSVVPSYSKWTEEGEKAVLSFIRTMNTSIVEAQEETMKNKSKELLMKSLKTDLTKEN